MSERVGVSHPHMADGYPYAAHCPNCRAIEVAAVADFLANATATLEARAQELSWCNKDDDCHARALGVFIAIDDLAEEARRWNA